MRCVGILRYLDSKPRTLSMRQKFWRSSWLVAATQSCSHAFRLSSSANISLKPHNCLFDVDRSEICENFWVIYCVASSTNKRSDMTSNATAKSTPRPCHHYTSTKHLTSCTGNTNTLELAVELSLFPILCAVHRFVRHVRIIQRRVVGEKYLMTCTERPVSHCFCEAEGKNTSKRGTNPYISAVFERAKHRFHSS